MASRREYDRMVRRIELTDSKTLRRLVAAAKAQEAKDVNRSGARRQLKYLLSVYSVLEIEQLLDEAAKIDVEVDEILKFFTEQKKLTAILRLTFSHKTREAEVLSESGFVSQIRYLLASKEGRQALEQCKKSLQGFV